ncbi:MAG: hypothetical protein WBI17_08930 [Clostridiaceae bacterium]
MTLSARRKKGTILLDTLIYLVMSLFLMISVLRIYLNLMKDYRENLQFLKYTDYAYQAFEVIKRDLYINTESVTLSNNVLYIKKLDKVNAPYIKLYMKDEKLRYTFGLNGFSEGSVFYLCYDLKAVSMNVVGDVLFIRLTFPTVTFERGFLIAY